MRGDCSRGGGRHGSRGCDLRDINRADHLENLRLRIAAGRRIGICDHDVALGELLDEFELVDLAHIPPEPKLVKHMAADKKEFEYKIAKNLDLYP
jgi:hypothetical protein